jgi:dihydroorotate dehydrogenase electron transfer subunit
MSKIVVEKAELIRKKNLGNDIFVLTFAPFSKLNRVNPGQFVHLQAPNAGVYFRRAFSVYDTNTDDKSFDILLKNIGQGTRLIASMKKGEMISVLGPLGNGFRNPKRNEAVFLIAGGVGMPPIYFFAKYLVSKKYNPKEIYFFYGGKVRLDVVELAKIRKLGVNLILASEDGSIGYHGLVTQAAEEWICRGNGKKNLYSCGPIGLLEAVEKLAVKYNIPGQLSCEAPMPCGIGICLGCILPLKAGGYTRVCREGPVYNIGEVVL